VRKWRGLKPLEKQVEAACDKLMASVGWQIVRFSQARASRQTAGIPDRKYYRDGLTFWFECKAEDGKQRPEQKAFQEMCERAGEFYVMGGPEAIVKFVNQHGDKWRISA
jgi:hypothetical protein